MNPSLTVWDFDQANRIKLAIAGVSPHVVRPEHAKTGETDSWQLNACNELLNIAEAICMANDWEYRRHG